MSVTFVPSKHKTNASKIKVQSSKLKNVWVGLVNEVESDWDSKDYGKRKNSSSMEALEDNDKMLLKNGYHGLAATIMRCFDDHHALILSPDAIWLNIVQQLAIHVSQNSEELRSKFVNFDGKKVLKVRRDDFIKGEENPWTEVFPEFAKQIREYVGEDNYNAIMERYSTTTPTTQAAMEVGLMDCMQSYFDYMMTTKCGIPEITLEGEREDWQKIVDKASNLGEYGMSWWTKQLIPVLEQFVNVFDGNVDFDFWGSFVKENGGSGGPYITGHMTKLFAYKMSYNDGATKIDEWLVHSGDFRGLTTSSFTSGISSVPFIWDYYSTSYPMTFSSGFVGIEVVGNSLKPNITWAVMDRNISDEDFEEEVARFTKELRSQGDLVGATSLASVERSTLEETVLA